MDKLTAEETSFVKELFRKDAEYKAAAQKNALAEGERRKVAEKYKAQLASASAEERKAIIEAMTAEANAKETEIRNK